MKSIHTFVLLLLLALLLNNVNSQDAVLLGNNQGAFAIGDSCSGPGTLRYDDGSLANGGGWNNTVTDGRWVLKFTPVSYPWQFTKFCIALTRLSSGTPNMIFDVVVYDTTGAGGAPGALVATVPGQTASGILVFPAFNWFSFNLATVPALTGGSYYIGIKYSAVSQLQQFVMFDEAPTLLRAGYGWANAGPWTPAQTYFTTYRCWGMRTEGNPSGGSTLYSRCKRGLNIFIPDNNINGVNDTFNVSVPGSPLAVYISKMYVIIDTLLHPFVGDIIFKITKGATTVNIVTRPGPGTGIFGSAGDNFIGTKFSDTSRYSIDSINNAGVGDPVAQFNQPFTGWFRCNRNAAGTTPPIMDSLARFNGSDPNGTWVINISDNAPGGIGELRSYCLIIEFGIVGINQQGSEIPNEYYINQNYPNPFNPVTNIKFGLPKAGDVKLVVFDVLGREVAVLVNEFKSAGQYVVDFDASFLSSGVYFYRIESGSFAETKKMLMVK